MSESKLQKDIIDWLKANGAYVIKTRVLPGVPSGCPDIIALYNDRWLVIEVKRSVSAPFRPGQQLTLQRLGNGNKFVYVAYPENWSLIKNEIATQFL